MRRLASLFVTMVLVAVPISAEGSIAVYDFTGSVDRVDPIGQGGSVIGISAGALVTGSFGIDLSKAIIPPPSGNSYGYSDALVDFNLVVGGVDFVPTTQGTVNITNDLPQASPLDVFQIGIRLLANGEQILPIIYISDSQGMMFSDLSLLNAENLSLDGFAKSFVLIFLDIFADNGQPQNPDVEARLTVDWQTLTLRTPVPEPTTCTLSLLGLAAIGIRHRRNTGRNFTT